MKFGIISDTHDHLDHIHSAKLLFASHNVEYIIHLGDYVAPFSLRLFQGIKLYGVFGNNDGDRIRLLGVARDIGAELMGDFYSFDEDSLSFACYHGTDSAITSALIRSGQYDVVLCGHTHQAVQEQIGKTLFINPGTAHGTGHRASVVIFDTLTKLPTFLDL